MSILFSGLTIGTGITQALTPISVIVITGETTTAMIVIVTTMIVIAIMTDRVIRGECDLHQLSSLLSDVASA